MNKQHNYAISQRSQFRWMLGLAFVLAMLFAVGKFAQYVSDLKSHFDIGAEVSEKDPCTAAHEFGAEARADTYRGSSAAILRMCEMHSPCVLYELVQLMDLPDGKHVGASARQEIWDAIHARADKLAGNPRVASYWKVPAYYPTASLAERIKVKQKWLEWLAEMGVGPTTRPATSTNDQRTEIRSDVCTLCSGVGCARFDGR